MANFDYTQVVVGTADPSGFRADSYLLLGWQPPLTWTANRSATSTVRVDFGRALRSLAATSNAGNYAISGPSVITVSSVAFTPGNAYVLLTVSGTFTANGTYTLTLSASTAQALADDRSNEVTPYNFYPAPLAPTALTWSAQRSSLTQLRVDFARALASLAATSIAGNYTVSGPSAISITSVSFTPGDSFVLLNFSGTFQATQTYQLSIAANTAQSSYDGSYNSTTPFSFFPAPNAIPQLTWSAQRIGTSQLRVDFARALRSLAATTNVANYAVSGPSAIAIASVAFTAGDSFVLLNFTGTFTVGQTYTLTLAASTAQALADDEYNTTTPFDFFPSPAPTPSVPVVDNFVPAAGSQINRGDSIRFDVTDPDGFRVVLLVAKYANGTWEVVHDGTAFAPAFSSASSRSAITNGYRYLLQRTGGWQSSGPTILPVAVDLYGSEN